MWGQMKTASNPQALLSSLMQQNPQMREVMTLVQQSGGDAKTAFYRKAQEMGVNPNDIINQLK